MRAGAAEVIRFGDEWSNAFVPAEPVMDEGEVPLFPWPETGPAFVRRFIAIPPGQSLVHHDGECRDALVRLEEGEIDLESACGSRCRLRPGAIFWLTGLRLRALHNPGCAPAVLVAVRRRRPAEKPAD